ncbi:arginase [Klebsormidium nitens]|uniref:arginase n=2 Tax=Klebsormidium TaxID=3174 RepID=A0A0U9HKY0_KLENI|nr:arginase [Klebsormidium nitens]|eukprot:GAQ85828.1 arginase [Klebsormidium nitens]
MGHTAPYRLRPESVQRVIEAALTLVRELVHLKGETVKRLEKDAEKVPALLGLPLGHNSSFQQGPAFAPALIRESMWCHSTNSFTEKGIDLNDIRNLVDVGNLPIQELRDCGVDDKQLFDAISSAVKIIYQQKPLYPIVMGGDHSVTWPVVRGVVEAAGQPVDILHFDAHPDMYDCFEGNRYSHASGFARIMEDGLARNLLQVGIRSITGEGRAQAKKFGVRQFEMHSYEDHREYLENLTLGEGCAGVYVSIDVDCLDPAYAPGISHHEPGGMSFRDVMNVLHNLKGNIIGADVVEYNPQRDRDSMTAMVAAKFVRELAAKMAK